MIDILKFTNIRVVADRLMCHPLLQNLQFETIIQHTVDFLSLLGFNELYVTNCNQFEVKDYRTELPPTIIRIDAVKTSDNLYLKSMTGAFNGTLENPAYKIQGNVLYTNIKNCILDIEYRELPTDEDGYPMILDNIHFIMALEAYIKMKTFLIYFDTGRIAINVLQQAQQDYSFRVAQLHSKMSLPSIEQMQSISNMWNKLHLTSKDFYTGFNLTTNLNTYKIH